MSRAVPWIIALRSAAAEEPTDQPLLMTLATMAADGSPRARMLVCRRIDEDGSLWFTTDARSEKASQLERNPRAAALCWLPFTRQQFRAAGTIECIGAAASADAIAQRLASWKQLNDASRAMFFWPVPGTPRNRDAAAFGRAIAATTPPPESFAVLRMRVDSVDLLELNPHPHHRCCWTAEDGAWKLLELNP